MVATRSHFPLAELQFGLAQRDPTSHATHTSRTGNVGLRCASLTYGLRVVHVSNRTPGCRAREPAVPRGPRHDIGDAFGLDSGSPCWSAAVDIIFLHDLRIETTIGIYDWERRIRQTVILDLEMATDAARAAATDRIEDALDYKAITKRVMEFVSSSEFRLVETLADRVAALVREEFAVPWVRLRLNKKYAIRGATDVGVVVERGERTA